MEKPITMSVKEYIIKTMSSTLVVPEKTISSVIDHQFSGVIEALKKHNSVEISGFGKFLFNRKKAEKKMEKMIIQKNLLEQKMNDETISQTRRNTAKYKYELALNNINELNKKLNNEN